MKRTIMDWLGLSNSQQATSSISIEHAAAALMVEIMYADDHCRDIEKDKILQLLTNSFSLTRQEAQTLLNQAQKSVENASDLYHFTRIVNQQFSMPQKEALIKKLWEVAFADQDLDRYEEHMIRKIADLLYVPHSRFIKSKLEVTTQQK